MPRQQRNRCSDVARALAAHEEPSEAAIHDDALYEYLEAIAEGRA